MHLNKNLQLALKILRLKDLKVAPLDFFGGIPPKFEH